MHCMDSDYSVFSILPPYSNVDAQVIDANGRLVVSNQNVQLFYSAVADPTGSINRSSIGKTNFWTFAATLYGGPSTPDLGLAGNAMPGFGNVPQPMTFVPGSALFHAEGVPITPYDDGGHKRYYPLLRIVAGNPTGTRAGSLQARVHGTRDRVHARRSHEQAILTKMVYWAKMLAWCERSPRQSSPTTLPSSNAALRT
jgi:hypothetical protein